MAKKAKKKAAPRRKITLVESNETRAALGARLKVPRGKRAVEVDLVVRAPDKVAEKALAATARLCACRRICIALV